MASKCALYPGATLHVNVLDIFPFVVNASDSENLLVRSSHANGKRQTSENVQT